VTSGAMLSYPPSFPKHIEGYPNDSQFRLCNLVAQSENAERAVEREVEKKLSQSWRSPRRDDQGRDRANACFKSSDGMHSDAGDNPRFDGWFAQLAAPAFRSSPIPLKTTN